MSSRAYGRIAKSPILHRALPTEHWAGQGTASSSSVLLGSLSNDLLTAICEARTYGGVSGEPETRPTYSIWRGLSFL